MPRGIVKRTLAELTATAAHSRSGKWALTRFFVGIGPITNPRSRLGTALMSSSLGGFEDLAFLFSSNVFNHGIAALRIDEAAYLYKLVRRLGTATIVEIGRFMGGSTLLIAAAMDERSRLVSFDLHTYDPGVDAHERADRELIQVLERYGFAERVDVVVGDSSRADRPTECDLVFVDGDHTYEGVRADYERWGPAVRSGGHLLFHDAIPCEFGPRSEGVGRLISEIERDARRTFAPVGSAGSVAHFVKS